MPGGREEKASRAGVSSANGVDVAALFAQLQEEVRRLGPRSTGTAGATSTRLNARAVAERLWPVSADRRLGGRTGARGAAQRPVKLVLRRLMRWYVEPVFADQRGFNDATLKLIDDLYERLHRLEVEVRALRESSESGASRPAGPAPPGATDGPAGA